MSYVKPKEQNARSSHDGAAHQDLEFKAIGIRPNRESSADRNLALR
jgi:hypothetical protein